MISQCAKNEIQQFIDYVQDIVLKVLVYKILTLRRLQSNVRCNKRQFSMLQVRIIWFFSHLLHYQITTFISLFLYRKSKEQLVDMKTVCMSSIYCRYVPIPMSRFLCQVTIEPPCSSKPSCVKNSF